jgi:hypothetical protein
MLILASDSLVDALSRMSWSMHERAYPCPDELIAFVLIANVDRAGQDGLEHLVWLLADTHATSEDRMSWSGHAKRCSALNRMSWSVASGCSLVASGG